MERVPIDLKKGDIVAVSVYVVSGGQLVAVGVKDPAGGDLLTLQPAATGVDSRPITFKAETDGRHDIVVAQMDSRGDPVAVTVKHYPVGS